MARPDQAQLDKYGIRGTSIFGKPDGNELAEITKLIEAGKIKPIVSEILPPDLRVQIVTSFPDKPGEWQLVDSFPDYKIEMVNSFPDFKIEFVTSFPGPAK